MRILVVHGFMQTIKVYASFAKKLAGIDYHVDCYKLRGVDDSEFLSNPIGVWTTELSDIIENGNYDVVIGFSLGCRVVLQTMQCINWIGKVILVNPAYGSLKICRQLLKLGVFLVPSIKLIQKCKLLTWLALRKTVKRGKSINRQMLESAKRCNPYVAAQLILEMAANYSYASDNPIDYYVITCADDKIIENSNIYALISDLEIIKISILHNCGHTPVVEELFGLLELVRLYMND